MTKSSDYLNSKAREILPELAKTVAMLSVDAVQQANSGHPGLPMGAAGYASSLWVNQLRFNPARPDWINRDRFILSAGHGSALLYSLLHIFGYDLPLSEVKAFRQWESKTPGHPEFGVTPGVECTTGPLGQGAANAVGVAISGKMMQQAYSKELFNHRVFALVSDGDLMEGVSAEAASYAGHLGLDNLIYLYDDNKISLAGETKVCFTESVQARYEAYGWFVQKVNPYIEGEFERALSLAIAEPNRPSLICVESIIGQGSPAKANSCDVHGSPLGEAELKATKENIGWPTEPKFFIPADIAEFCRQTVEAKVEEYQAWSQKFEKWQRENPELAQALDAQLNRRVPEALKAELAGGLGHSKKEATRSLSGKAIQVMAKHLPYFTGGSADLEPSTKTLIKDSAEIQAGAFAGRNFRFGVREHAMGSVANGLAYQRCWLPFTATFLVFADYMRPTVRLAALSHLQTLFVFTHDSFWVGEDGPTHEPVEQIQSLRIIPNLNVFRPADGVEVGMSYYAAATSHNKPSALLFTRQDLPPVERRPDFNPEEVLKGGYVVYSPGDETVSIIATGSELQLAVEASKLLKAEGISVRVVSMPCVELFQQQPASYQEQVLGVGLKRVTIEAGVTSGWANVTGSSTGPSLHIGLDRYGASAPGEVLAEKFGFTPSAIAARVRDSLR